MDRIKKSLEEKVKPYLKEHGGDIELVSFEDGIVKVRFLGACRGCASASITLEEVVKGALKDIPEVKDVIVADYISDEMWDYAKKFLNRSQK